MDHSKGNGNSKTIKNNVGNSIWFYSFIKYISVYTMCFPCVPDRVEFFILINYISNFSVNAFPIRFTVELPRLECKILQMCDHTSAHTQKIKLFLIIWWNLTYNTIIGSYLMLIQILRIVSHPYNCWKRTNRCQMKMDDEFRKIYVPDRFFGERDIHVKFSWWLVMVVVESKFPYTIQSALEFFRFVSFSSIECDFRWNGIAKRKKRKVLNKQQQQQQNQLLWKFEWNRFL